MFVKDITNGNMVEVRDAGILVDPCQAQVEGRYHAGEELQEYTLFDKSRLVFPSGEGLPLCWRDPDYRH